MRLRFGTPVGRPGGRTPLGHTGCGCRKHGLRDHREPGVPRAPQVDTSVLFRHSADSALNGTTPVAQTLPTGTHRGTHAC